MSLPAKKPAAPALGDARARLKRLLLLVPLVSRHPGRPVDEIARELGITRDELLEDLDLATMVGRPPFQPDDFVDVYVEDDRVFVELDQRFSRPPRLTTAEAVALAAAANLLKGDGDDALARAVAKLERVLPAGAGEAFRALHGRLDTTPGAPGEVPSLARALAESREVEFDYLAASRGVPEHRRVRPRELLQRGGAWYLSGFCLARQEERLFRLDRVARLDGDGHPLRGPGARRPGLAPRRHARPGALRRPRRPLGEGALRRRRPRLWRRRGRGLGARRFAALVDAVGAVVGRRSHGGGASGGPRGAGRCSAKVPG